LRYDYTKNLTYSGEDKAVETYYAIANKIIEAVNHSREEVDLSEFDMPDKIFDAAFMYGKRIHQGMTDRIQPQKNIHLCRSHLLIRTKAREVCR